MRALMTIVESAGDKIEQDGYRLEYQNSKTLGTDAWEIYKPLRRGRHFGAVFDALCWFPKGTPREIVKRHFWKTYKIDIDKLPNWQRCVKMKSDHQP